jgi:pimeloyl-ACP methyl ester carboxylesterase
MRKQTKIIIVLVIALGSMLGVTACLPAAEPSATSTPPVPAAGPAVEVTEQVAKEVTEEAAEEPGEGVTEEEVTFANGAVQLVGTLTLPTGPGPHPVVITVTGSGPQDRDNAAAELPDYRPYRQLAAALAATGIATLRFDDRGVGASTGDITTATPPELAGDVEAALAYLADRSDIDSARVGLVGHSEGASVAAIAAAHRPEIRAVVALAGPALSGAALQEEMLSQLNPAAAAQEARVLELVQAGAWAELEEQLTQWTVEQLQALPQEGQDALGDLQTLARAQAAQNVEQVYRNPRYLYTLTHDPSEDWRKVQAPVLALYAQYDELVAVAQNKPALEAALLAAGNPEFAIDLVPGVNHLFLAADASTTPEQWAQLLQQVSADVIDKIASWMKQHLQ